MDTVSDFQCIYKKLESKSVSNYLFIVFHLNLNSIKIVFIRKLSKIETLARLYGTWAQLQMASVDHSLEN